MGNKQSAKPLSSDVYTEKLKSISEQKENINNKPIQLLSGAGDVHVLQIIIEYCERREQVRIIEAVTNDQRNTILSNIRISPYADVYAIADFNKKNVVFDDVDGARELMFKLYFTNLVVKGKKTNLEYLLSNASNIMLTFLHYVAVRKGDILSSKTENEKIEIDLFVEKFIEHKTKEFSFNLEDIFTNNEDKLDNIKYKNAYKFEKIGREIELNDINVSWRLLNDTFLRYLITNQLNYCFDDEESKSKDINDDINLKHLDILSGSSLINAALSGYIINSTTTKHQTFKVGRSVKTQRIESKVSMTTNKLSSVFLVPATLSKHYKDKNKDDIMECGIMVLTARNPSSENHIKEKSSIMNKVYANIVNIDDVFGGGNKTTLY